MAAQMEERTNARDDGRAGVRIEVAALGRRRRRRYIHTVRTAPSPVLSTSEKAIEYTCRRKTVLRRERPYPADMPCTPGPAALCTAVDAALMTVPPHQFGLRRDQIAQSSASQSEETDAIPGLQNRCSPNHPGIHAGDYHEACNTDYTSHGPHLRTMHEARVASRTNLRVLFDIREQYSRRSHPTNYPPAYLPRDRRRIHCNQVCSRHRRCPQSFDGETS